MQKLNDMYKYAQPGMMNPAMMNPVMNAGTLKQLLYFISFQ